MTDSTILNWGLVGTSGFAGGHFAKALVEAENASLAAVVSHDPDRAEKFASRVKAGKAYTSVAELAADTEIDAVWVASPNHMHFDHAKSLLEAGKHVLCEKPLALTSAHCRKLFDTAEKAGKKLTVGYNMRQDPLLKSLKARVDAGEFGKPGLVRVNRFHAYPDDPSPWRRQKQTSGGWSINDIGTHCIDQCIWFLGYAKTVSGHLATRRFDVETDDLSLVAMTFESGALGSIEVSTALTAGPPRVEFYGTGGWFVVEHGRLASVIRHKEQVGKDDAVDTTVDNSGVNLFKLEAEAFGRAALGLEEVAVPSKDAVHNIEIIEQARGFSI